MKNNQWQWTSFELPEITFSMPEKQVEASFIVGENPCLHIENSYLLEKGRTIMAELEYIHTKEGYKTLCESGYTRTIKSEYREWKAHNFLYRIGFMRSRTGSVDIDQNEPMWRRFIYAILSIF